jgi:hypothetical protein
MHMFLLQNSVGSRVHDMCCVISRARPRGGGGERDGKGEGREKEQKGWGWNESLKST